MFSAIQSNSKTDIKPEKHGEMCLFLGWSWVGFEELLNIIKYY